MSSFFPKLTNPFKRRSRKIHPEPQRPTRPAPPASRASIGKYGFKPTITTKPKTYVFYLPRGMLPGEEWAFAASINDDKEVDDADVKETKETKETKENENYILHKATAKRTFVVKWPRLRFVAGMPLHIRVPDGRMKKVWYSQDSFARTLQKKGVVKAKPAVNDEDKHYHHEYADVLGEILDNLDESDGGGRKKKRKRKTKRKTKRKLKRKPKRKRKTKRKTKRKRKHKRKTKRKQKTEA